MQDLAHALQCKHRSQQDLQSLILAEQYGNQPGQLKPLEKLLVVSLREELTARGCETADMLKAQLTAELKGAQRVPTFLYLTQLNLLKIYIYKTMRYLTVNCCMTSKNTHTIYFRSFFTCLHLP